MTARALLDTRASVSLEGLRLTLGSSRILDDVSVTALEPGTVTALIGPNGAGKSSLLRAVAGWQRVDGVVRHGEDDLAKLSFDSRARRIAYVPQSLPEASRLTVFEALLGAAAVHPVDADRVEAATSRVTRGLTSALTTRVLDALDEFAVAALAHRRLDTLSGGQRQLVGLAQAFVRAPALLLLDEPTSALDLHHQCRVMDAMVRHTRAHARVTLWVVHDIALAMAHADRIVVLHEGRVAAFGAPHEVVDAALLAKVYRVDARVHRTERGAMVEILGPL